MSSAEKTPQLRFKVGDLVKLRPFVWKDLNHKHEVGLIIDIKSNVAFPYLVSFTAPDELFAEDELEKI